MKRPLHVHHAGFTLIELLIVMVIIAILATLALISVAGIRDRASNTRTIAGVTSFIKAAQSYQILTGEYPPTPNEGYDSIAMVCIGIGYPGGTCGKVTGTRIYESSEFMDMLAEELGASNNIVNIDKSAVGSEDFQGAVYGIDSVGPPAPHTGYGRVVEWFLYGKNQGCGVSDAYAYNTDNGNTACEYFIEPYE